MSPEPVDPLASATEHAELGLPLPGTASALPKRLVERLSRFFLEPQRAYNRGVIDAIRILRDDNQRLADKVAQQGDDIERLASGLRSELAQAQLDLSEGQTDAALTRGQVVDLARTVQRLESRVAKLDTEPPGSAGPIED